MADEQEIQNLLSQRKATEVLRIIVQGFRERFENKGKKVIAVLGAFDAWPYIDYVSRLLARNGHGAVTSIRIYLKNERGRIDIQSRPKEFRSISMRDSLKLMIEEEAHQALILYSVPGAHYIETDWCYERLKKDKDFSAIGIAFVRNVNKDDSDEEKNGKCSLLSPVAGFHSAFCDAKPVRTAWDCMKQRSFCPFIEQQVAKNVIEYFFLSPRMRLYALDRLDVLPRLLNQIT